MDSSMTSSDGVRLVTGEYSWIDPLAAAPLRRATAGYLKSDRRMLRPIAMVIVPTGCLA